MRRSEALAAFLRRSDVSTGIRGTLVSDSRPHVTVRTQTDEQHYRNAAQTRQLYQDGQTGHYAAFRLKGERQEKSDGPTQPIGERAPKF